MSCTLNAPQIPKPLFPSFGDLGRECRSLFNKGYHFGLFQISVRNTTCHGMEVVTRAEHKNEDKSAKADVEVSAMYPYYGIGSYHKWDTENNLINEVNVEELFPGGRLALEGRFNGDSLDYGGAFRFQQKHPLFTLDAATEGGTGENSNVIIGGSVVTGHKGLMAAYKVDYDINNGNLATNNLAVAYQNKDCCLLLGYNNLTVVNASYFHKIGRELEVGCLVKVGDEGGAGGEGGEGGGSGPQFGIAGKFTFSGYGHTVRAKVDNQSKLGLGLELKIVQGFNASASGEMNLKEFNGGNHKIGFGLDFGV